MRGEWRRRQCSASAFGLTPAEGRPDIYQETPVTFTGWKLGIDDTRWLLTGVSHEIGNGGYVTRVQCEIKPGQARDA